MNSPEFSASSGVPTPLSSPRTSAKPSTPFCRQVDIHLNMYMIICLEEGGYQYGDWLYAMLVIL